MQEPCRVSQRFILSVSTIQGKLFADRHFFGRFAILGRSGALQPNQDRHSPQIRQTEFTEQAESPEPWA